MRRSAALISLPFQLTPMMRIKPPLVALSALTSMATLVQAVELVYEGFDYDATTTGISASSLGGGIGLSGNWVSSGTGNFNITDTSLSGGALASTGRKLERTSNGGVEQLFRAVSADLDSHSSLWFSVLYDTSSNGGFGITTDGFDGNQNPVMSGTSGSGFAFVHNGDTLTAQTFVSGSRSQSGGVNISSAGVLYLVGEVIFDNNGGSDTFNLYDATGGTTVGAALFTLTADVDQTLLDTIAITTNRGPAYDEIRIGTAAADLGISLVPEPSTFAMLAGLSALASVMIRRRQ